MVTTVIDKKNWNIFTISVYLWYFRSARLCFTISGTNEEYFESFRYACLFPCFFFFLPKCLVSLFVFCKNHGINLVPAVFCFKIFCLVNCLFILFNKWYLSRTLGTIIILICITICNLVHPLKTFLDKQLNRGTSTGFGLISPGNYPTFLRKNSQSLNISSNSSRKIGDNNRA